MHALCVYVHGQELGRKGAWGLCTYASLQLRGSNILFQRSRLDLMLIVKKNEPQTNYGAPQVNHTTKMNASWWRCIARKMDIYHGRIAKEMAHKEMDRDMAYCEEHGSWAWCIVMVHQESNESWWGCIAIEDATQWDNHCNGGPLGSEIVKEAHHDQHREELNSPS